MAQDEIMNPELSAEFLETFIELLGGVAAALGVLAEDLRHVRRAYDLGIIPTALASELAGKLLRAMLQLDTLRQETNGIDDWLRLLPKGEA